jgi:hypothetical protein
MAGQHSLIYMTRPTTFLGVIFWILLGVGTWMVYSSIVLLAELSLELSIMNGIVFGLAMIFLTITIMRNFLNPFISFLLFGLGSWFIYFYSKDLIVSSFELNPFFSMIIGFLIIIVILTISKIYGIKFIVGFSR